MPHSMIIPRRKTGIIQTINDNNSSEKNAEQKESVFEKIIGKIVSLFNKNYPKDNNLTQMQPLNKN